jgi:4-hydroxyphenylpyruvate dioxygenase
MALQEKAQTNHALSQPVIAEADCLKINSCDHIHLWVGNAKQAMYYWWKAFGFQPVAYSGLETGNREFASYLLKSGEIQLVVSAPYSPTSQLATHHMLHGSGVKVIAFGVDNVETAWRETIARGAISAWAPCEQADNYGRYRTAAIRAYGDTLHVFVNRSDYHGPFAPTYEPLDLPYETCGLVAVDHIAGNVPLGQMNMWIKFYSDVMGFRQLHHFDDKDISTEYSALMSKGMENSNGRVMLTISEPAVGKRKSQIEEFLDYYYASGVQHIAMRTDDIIETMNRLRECGIEFLRVPDTYYELLSERVGEIKESLERIHELGILVDRDVEGYLLQVFTRSIQDRPTMFIEIIQRHGSRGFGKGNFKALFESLELEQARRGNL